MSQLDLAAAGTTSGHLSFVETGRSRPRRDLILRIAGALMVPLSERNTLLGAASLPPVYPAGGAAGAELTQVFDRFGDPWNARRLPAQTGTIGV